MSDFESELSRTPLRGVPPDWRGNILRAARAAAEPPPSPWWRRWIAPQPLALAAAWGIIIALQVATPKESARPLTNLAEAKAQLHAQQTLLAELLQSPAPPPAQRPRQGVMVPRRKHQPA